jgi:quercetin dioxygenase-like cupin family protein
MLSPRRYENPITCESIVFRSVTGPGGQSVLEMEYTIGVGGAEVPEHAHPRSTQRIRVLQGRLGFSLRGEESVLTAGMEINVPPNTNHAQWNAGTEPVVTLEHLDPPMEFEEFFASYCRLGQEGRLNQDGKPKNPLQAVAWLYEFRETSSIATPGRYAMLAILSALYPVSKLLGYKGR